MFAWVGVRVKFENSFLKAMKSKKFFENSVERNFLGSVKFENFFENCEICKSVKFRKIFWKLWNLKIIIWKQWNLENFFKRC